jgi:hypothetical protein
MTCLLLLRMAAVVTLRMHQMAPTWEDGSSSTAQQIYCLSSEIDSTQEDTVCCTHAAILLHSGQYSSAAAAG